MERQAHYAAVGLVTLVLASILLGFAFWFIKFDFNKDYGVYDVEFNQPVDWLNKGAEVHFNGIKVGEVTSLRLGKPGTHQVFARVQLDAGTPVRTDSVATLMPQGITGLLYMQISPGTAKAPLLKRRLGDPVPIIHSVESPLQKLLSGSGSVVEKTYESLDRVNRLLSDENIRSVTNTLNNIEDITEDLKQRKQLLDDAHEAVVAAGQAADAITQLAHSTNGVMSNQVPATMDQINAAAQKLSVAADQVSRTAAEIQKPVDQVNNSTLPALEESLQNLNEAAASVKTLVDSVQSSPRGLIARPEAKERKVSQ
jgi:phospholipid/cholesterol/gamma-HCH transport system substrate-binding protein